MAKSKKSNMSGKSGAGKGDMPAVAAPPAAAGPASAPAKVWVVLYKNGKHAGERAEDLRPFAGSDFADLERELVNTYGFPKGGSFYPPGYAPAGGVFNADDGYKGSFPVGMLGLTGDLGEYAPAPPLIYNVVVDRRAKRGREGSDSEEEPTSKRLRDGAGERYDTVQNTYSIGPFDDGYGAAVDLQSLDKIDVGAIKNLRLGEDFLTFVNREGTIKTMLSLCSDNRFHGGVLQSVHVPIVAHMYGAGKTALANRFFDVVKKGEYRSGEGVVAVIKRSVCLTTVVTCVRGDTVATVQASILFGINKELESEHSDVVSAVQAANQRGPLLIAIDEIHYLGRDGILETRDFLGGLYLRVFLTHSKVLPAPLFVYMCGRTSHDLHRELVRRGGGSSVCHDLLYLEPLRAEHVRVLRETAVREFAVRTHVMASRQDGKLPRKNCSGCNNLLSSHGGLFSRCPSYAALGTGLHDFGVSGDAIDAVVAEVAGGIPRLIQRLLSLMLHLRLTWTSPETMRADVFLVAARAARSNAFASDFVRSLSNDDLNILCNKLRGSLCGQLYTKDEIYATRYLPFLTTAFPIADGEVRYKVTLGPMAYMALRGPLNERLARVADIVFRPQQYLAQCDARELQVVHALQRALIVPSLDSRTWTRGADGDTLVSVDLVALLPFLVAVGFEKGAVELRGVCAREKKARVFTKAKPAVWNDIKGAGTAAGGTTGGPVYVPLDGGDDDNDDDDDGVNAGGPVQPGSKTSHSADVFFYVPDCGAPARDGTPQTSTGSMMLEFQVKSGDTPIGWPAVPMELAKSVGAEVLAARMAAREAEKKAAKKAAKGKKKGKAAPAKLVAAAAAEPAPVVPDAAVRAAALACPVWFFMVVDKWTDGLRDAIKASGRVMMLTPGSPVGQQDVVPEGVCLFLLEAALFNTWAPKKWRRDV